MHSELSSKFYSSRQKGFLGRLLTTLLKFGGVRYPSVVRQSSPWPYAERVLSTVGTHHELVETALFCRALRAYSSDSCKLVTI